MYIFNIEPDSFYKAWFKYHRLDREIPLGWKKLPESLTGAAESGGPIYVVDGVPTSQQPKADLDAEDLDREIQAKIERRYRRNIISELKSEGEIPDDYEDVV